jgi:hypothetical protein
MNTFTSREHLIESQRALVSALTLGKELPFGFDARRVRVAADSLLAKRTRSIARVWPSFKRELGNSFDNEFARFATDTPLPKFGGPLADGRNFADWLMVQREVSDEIRARMLSIDLRFFRRGRDLIPRKGPKIAITFLSKPRRLLIAVRFWRKKETFFTLP